MYNKIWFYLIIIHSLVHYYGCTSSKIITKDDFVKRSNSISADILTKNLHLYNLNSKSYRVKKDTIYLYDLGDLGKKNTGKIISPVDQIPLDEVKTITIERVDFFPVIITTVCIAAVTGILYLISD
jgi:hypothetical protein